MSAREQPPSSTGGGAHPTRIGHYRVLEVLGTGVLSNVYRAETEGIGRVVALKVLRSTAGAESAFFRRFEREARLLATLHHTNLIELYDFDVGVAGERAPYMVMEHIAGATLAEVMQKLRPNAREEGVEPAATSKLEPEEAAAIALEVARALAYAHAQGIVHRDVKPSNVLIGRTEVRDGSTALSDRPIVVKLVDFGIAQDSPRGAIDTPSEGEAIGTPAYMAPEQLLGETVDHRADQFALGIVLYQMLAGVRPFDGDDGRPAIQRVRRDPPRPFKSLGVTVPRALERLVLRCLAKRPADRFDSTNEVVDELVRFFEERMEGTSDLSAFHRRVLARAGVLDERKTLREESAEATRPIRSAPLRVRAVPIGPTVIGVALSFVAMVGGGGVIQFRGGGMRGDRSNTENSRPPSTDVGSGEVGVLRVLVRPWADVVVDGEKIDTTPFSRPIRLRAGRHVVNLVHPSAKERRVIDVRAGETTTLDVVLNVQAPTTFADEYNVPETSPSTAPSSSNAKGTPFGVPSTLAGGAGK